MCRQTPAIDSARMWCCLCSRRRREELGVIWSRTSTSNANNLSCSRFHQQDIYTIPLSLLSSFAHLLTPLVGCSLRTHFLLYSSLSSAGELHKLVTLANMHLVLMLQVGPRCHQQPKAAFVAALTCEHGSGLASILQRHKETRTSKRQTRQVSIC